MGLKAKVIATGEIFDIEGVSLRLNGKVRSTFGLDEVEILMPDLTPDYWTRLEHQAAIAAMQAYIIASHISQFSFCEGDMKDCKSMAHALVEKYKKEERK